MRVMRWLLGAALTFAALHPAAAQTEDPYVTLYRQRVEVAKAHVGKAQAQRERDYGYLDMIRRLYAQRAASADELRNANLACNLSDWSVNEAKVKVSEAEALLDVALARTAAGLDMPICTVH